MGIPYSPYVLVYCEHRIGSYYSEELRNTLRNYKMTLTEQIQCVLQYAIDELDKQYKGTEITFHTGDDFILFICDTINDLLGVMPDNLKFVADEAGGNITIRYNGDIFGDIKQLKTTVGFF